MKNKDKICEAFDALSKEMDAKLTDNTESIARDQDSIDIDAIENSIMDKIEKMIETKLSTLTVTKEVEPIEQAQDIENKGDENNED